MEYPSMTNQESTTNRFYRRQILKWAGYGTLGFMAGQFRPFLDLAAASQHGAADKKPGFVPDLDISLIARPGEVPIFPGEPTQVWQYHAMVHTGDKNRLTELPGSYLGPTIKAH